MSTMVAKKTKLPIGLAYGLNQTDAKQTSLTNKFYL